MADSYLDDSIAKARSRTLMAAKIFSRLMAEYGGEVKYCSKAMEEVMDAADHLANLEALKEDHPMPSEEVKRLRTALIPIITSSAFKIGNLRIAHCDEPSMIWIDRDGESGYFSLNELYTVIQEFVSERL